MEWNKNAFQHGVLMIGYSILVYTGCLHLDLFDETSCMMSQSSSVLYFFRKKNPTTIFIVTF